MGGEQPMASRWLAEKGLNLQAVFDLSALPDEVRVALGSPRELAPFRQLWLLGNGGPAFWRAYRRQSAGTGADPLDRFAAGCVREFLRQAQPGCRYRLLYPGAAPIPLQALGRLAGWHHCSPMMVGINARWGLWFAYRVALLVDSDLTPTAAWREPSPCGGCDARPCVGACPAGALASGKLQLERCLTYRRRADSPCRYRCLAREACPVGAAHRYGDEQIRYHYGCSLAVIAPLDFCDS